MMASFLAGLSERITGDAGFAALCADRLYVEQAPRGAGTDRAGPTYPYVVYQLISEPRATASDVPDGTATTRLQFTAYAQGPALAEAVMLAVKAAAIGDTGRYTLPNGVFVSRAVVADRRGGYDPSARAHAKQIDIIFENNGD